MYHVMEGFYFTINSFLLCSSITLANQLSISSHSALRLLGAAGGNHQLRLRKDQPLLGHRHCSDIPLYLQFLFLHPVSSLSTLFKPQILPHLKEITSYFTETTEAVISKQLQFLAMGSTHVPAWVYLCLPIIVKDVVLLSSKVSSSAVLLIPFPAF